MLPRKNSISSFVSLRSGIRTNEKHKSKAKYIQEIQSFASIPLRGSEQIFHTRLEELHSRLLFALSRSQMDTLLTYAKERIHTIVHLDPSPKLQQRAFKWAAVYFLASCTTALRFASKRPSAALVDHITLSVTVLNRETALNLSLHNSYGSPSRLFNIIILPFARKLHALSSHTFKLIHERLGLSRGREPVGFALRSSYALESKMRAKSLSPSSEKKENTTFREPVSDLSDPTKTSSATPIGQPFMIKVPHIDTLHLGIRKSAQQKDKRELEREERKTPVKQFKSPAPVNAFKIMMESQGGRSLKKGRRPRSTACLETGASESMRMASTVDETVWAQSDDEAPLKPYKHDSKNIERALKRYNADLKKNNGLPILNLTSYFDEMASQ